MILGKTYSPDTVFGRLVQAGLCFLCGTPPSPRFRTSLRNSGSASKVMTECAVVKRIKTKVSIRVDEDVCIECLEESNERGPST